MGLRACSRVKFTFTSVHIYIYIYKFDTYNPDVIGTESWLSEEINNAEVFRDDYITFRRDKCSWGGGVFMLKITSIAGSYGLMRILRW